MNIMAEGSAHMNTMTLLVCKDINWCYITSNLGCMLSFLNKRVKLQLIRKKGIIYEFAWVVFPANLKMNLEIAFFFFTVCTTCLRIITSMYFSYLGGGLKLYFNTTYNMPHVCSHLSVISKIFMLVMPS